MDDLFELIGEEAFNHADCFNSQSYWKWEQEIATPILEAKGFIVSAWFDGERDSFGPLSRGVKLEKDGIVQTLYYG